MTSPSPDHRIEQLLRELAPEILGAVVRRHRDFAASEDAVQDALIAAATQWAREGIPPNPRGWLVNVAQRRMVDQLRSAQSRQVREQVVADDLPRLVEPQFQYDCPFDPQDTLVLLFMCCHPSLTAASAIALTLRVVGGLTTPEIAKAFLVPESTIGQRISRAKQSIKSSNLPFLMPDHDERAQRLDSVLHVLYLIFSEGYSASSGETLQRTDLSREAIRLTRQLHRLLPDSGNVTGLLALMLLTDARRAARSGPNGELVPLDEQDRAQWDQAQIAEGIALASDALSQGAIGEYQLQAAIAAVHDESPHADQTDWRQILLLYEMLMRLTQNPMVALNHAIATAMVHGPDAGLALLESLAEDERLRQNHRVDAVRGHLLERAGQRAAATLMYRAASAKTTSTPERDYLLMKATRLAAG